jgi:hypothetical protein
MIPVLPGWTAGESDSGDVHTPAEDPGLGAIHYVERLQPLHSIEDLLVEQLARDRRFHVEDVRGPETFVTAEGEHAAFASVLGEVDGEVAQQDIGYVLFEDHYARIGGETRRPDQFGRFSDAVRTLTYRCRQMLGVRPRRFLYDEPEDWQLRARGLRADWLYHAEDRSCITVWPALPAEAGDRGSADRWLAGQIGPWRASRPFPVRSSAGLGGKLVEVAGRFADGATLRRDLVVFEDGRYLYPLRFDAAPTMHERLRETFWRVVRSAGPIPRPAGQPSAALRDVFAHWD